MRTYNPSPRIRELTKLEVAYLAGIIDGEGCIGLAWRTKKYVTPTLQVGNTNYDLIEWLVGITGSCYFVPERRDKPNWKDRYLWRCAGMQARELIRMTYPFLIVKKRQARVVLKLHEDVGVGLGKSTWRRFTEEDFIRIKRAKEKVSALNQGG